MPHVITEPCIGSKAKACVAACPSDCIHEGEKMCYIDPDACIDCDACREPCPTQAIFAVEDLPDKWKFYAEINKNFYPEKNEAKAWGGRAFPK